MADIEYVKKIPQTLSANTLTELEQLLSLSGLTYDVQIEQLILAYDGSQLVACGGLDQHIIKCIAVLPAYRGLNLIAGLLNEILVVAHEQRHFHLFLYTRPENKRYFVKSGFYPLVEINDLIVLMENSPIGIQRYCANLARQRQPGMRIGSIVMNANPCTKGHVYLAECAAAACDWLHIFVVRDERSQFPFKIRYELVKQSLAHLNNITLHEGSDYIISRATFPAYFLKQTELVEQAYLGIDLLLFRNYIAPALGITHRFVGTEPHSPITHLYNQAMHYWLQTPTLSDYSAIQTVEIARKQIDGVVISASKVRQLLAQGEYLQLNPLVSEATWSFLQQRHQEQEGASYEYYTRGFRRNP